MLEFLIKGLYSIVGKALTLFMGLLLQTFDITLDRFLEVFPVAEGLLGVLIGVGWSISISLMLLLVARNMVIPPTERSEHPIAVAVRLIPVAFLLANTRAIIKVVFDLGNKVYGKIMDYDYVPGAAASIDTTFLGDLQSGIENGIRASVSSLLPTDPAFILIALILLLFLSWQLIKLFLEIAERYVTLCVGAYLSPIAFSTFVSKETSGIFTSFCSFMAGQMVLMWLNVWSLKMIAEGFKSFGNSSIPFFLHYLILLSFIILAQKLDNLLAKLGFKNILGGPGAGLLAAGAIAHAAGAVMKLGTGLAKKAGQGSSDRFRADGKQKAPNSANPTTSIPRFEPPQGMAGWVSRNGGTSSWRPEAAPVTEPSAPRHERKIVPPPEKPTAPLRDKTDGAFAAGAEQHARNESEQMQSLVAANNAFGAGAGGETAPNRDSTGAENNTSSYEPLGIQGFENPAFKEETAYDSSSTAQAGDGGVSENFALETAGASADYSTAAKFEPQADAVFSQPADVGMSNKETPAQVSAPQSDAAPQVTVPQAGGSGGGSSGQIERRVSYGGTQSKPADAPAPGGTTQSRGSERQPYRSGGGIGPEPTEKFKPGYRPQAQETMMVSKLSPPKVVSAPVGNAKKGNAPSNRSRSRRGWWGGGKQPARGAPKKRKR